MSRTTLLLGLFWTFFFSWPTTPLHAQWRPRSWNSVPPPELLAALADGKEETVCPIAQGKDFGLETDRPARINRLTIRYVALHGHFLQPEPRSATVEIWRNERWQKVRADVRIDYSAWNELAPYQMYGTVTWTCRFAPIETTRVRLLVGAIQQPMIQWLLTTRFRGVVIREVRADLEEPSPAATPTGRIEEYGKERLAGLLSSISPVPAPVVPKERPPECLTAPMYRPTIQAQNGGLLVSWPRKRMVSMVRIKPAAGATVQVEWWDGAQFRPVEKPQPAAASDKSGMVEVRFLPIATARLRIAAPGIQPAGLEVFLDARGQSYHAAAKEDPTDVLGDRVLAGGEPDLGRVAGMVLPMDFLKGYCGRPDDIEETMLTWDGKLILRHGPGAERQHMRDRFVFFALDGRPIGHNAEEIKRGLIDDWMPGVYYHLDRPPVIGRMTVFTTVPADGVYADRVRWELQTQQHEPGEVSLEIVLGDRLTTYGYFTKNAAGEAHPAIFAPGPTDFQLDADGRTVRDAAGSIVLHSSRSGRWGGTPLEPRLEISVPLAPDRTAQLDLVIPHVGQKLRNAVALATTAYERSLDLFRRHWQREVDRAAQFVVPEPAVNNIVRNALCQCLIVPDAGVPFYGTYWYEWLIGLEEYWPTIALAQFDRSEARLHLAAMARVFLPESNHHAPYVNSLVGWGAREVALLSGDMNWYAGLRETLKKRAEWTIRSAALDNRGTPYEGLVRKFGYGGDVHAPAHSLYNNVSCWRGLRDTGLMFRELGDRATADCYLAEAEKLRGRILAFWQAKIDHSTQPPFVPFGFDIGYKDRRDSYAAGYQDTEKAYERLFTLNLGNYWNLFMQILLELQVHPAGRPEPAWIRQYCRQHGGVTLGLARFRYGVDWHYGIGYIKSLLWAGRREDFLLSFYGALAHGAAQDVRTSPEDCTIWPGRTDNLSLREELHAARWNWQSGYDEALGSSPGVILQLVRSMLVDEGFDDRGDDGSLRLLSGIPRAWLEDGKEIHARRAATHFGPLSLDVVSQVQAGRIDVAVDLDAPRGPLSRIVLKVPHPQRRPIRSVRVNGKERAPADAETIILDRAQDRHFRIVVLF
jgi:hypothetical protein